jgi:hypothetical protein
MAGCQSQKWQVFPRNPPQIARTTFWRPLGGVAAVWAGLD